MNNLVRPAYLTNRQLRNVGDFVSGLGVAQPPRISIKDDRFTVLDETGMALSEPSLQLDVIIIGVNKNPSRIFYGMDPANPSRKKPYNPNDSTGPLCWSDNGVGPSKSCAEPQAPTCGSCEWAKWGSAISQMTGKGIPACSSTKKLAVLVSGHEGMFLLNVPPDSLKNYQQYIGAIAKIPANPEEYVTRIKLQDKNLQFEQIDFTPQEYLEGIVDQLISDDAMSSIVNKHDEARDPQEFKQLSAAGPSVAPQIEPPQAVSAPAAAPRPRGRPPKSNAGGSPQLVAPTPAPTTTSFGAVQAQPATQAPSPPNPPFQVGGGAVSQGPGPIGFGFGVAQPAAPDPGVQGMLDRAFSLPRRS